MHSTSFIAFSFTQLNCLHPGGITHFRPFKRYSCMFNGTASIRQQSLIQNARIIHISRNHNWQKCALICRADGTDEFELLLFSINAITTLTSFDGTHKQTTHAQNNQFKQGDRNVFQLPIGIWSFTHYLIGFQVPVFKIHSHFALSHH